MIRRFLAIVLILMFCVVPCANAEIDLSGYSESELRNLIQQARSELTKYNSPAENGTILYEDEYVRITFSKIRYDSGMHFIDCIVENKSSLNLRVYMERVSCNGWDVQQDFVSVNVNTSSKSRDYFALYIEHYAGISSVEEIEEIRYMIKVADDDTNKTLNKPEGYFYLDMPITAK